jgi:cytochrome c2
MPSSVRFVLILLGLGVLAAIASGVLQHHESRKEARTVAEQITHGDSVAGKAAIRRYGCGGCHVIGGIADARGTVGPPLSGIATRAELSAGLANTPDNMARWLRDPQGIRPGSGMPDLGVSERDGRDMAAYLYTLEPMMPPS